MAQQAASLCLFGLLALFNPSAAAAGPSDTEALLQGGVQVREQGWPFINWDTKEPLAWPFDSWNKQSFDAKTVDNLELPPEAEIEQQREQERKAKMAHEKKMTTTPGPDAWEMPLVPADAIWEPVKYFIGEHVEGRGEDGRWVPCNVTARRQASRFDLECMDIPQASSIEVLRAHQFWLPSVPTESIRRTLDVGDSDFLVDNSELHHQGKGLHYRFNKDKGNVSTEFVGWGNIIVAEDQGDGWVRTDRGFYLPTHVNGTRVLIEHDRPGAVALKRRKRRSSAFSSAYEEMLSRTKDAGEHLQLEISDHAMYKTKRGEWVKCRIAMKNPDGTFNLFVTPAEYAVFAVANVPPENVRRVGLPVHTAQLGESALCQKVGCLTLLINTSAALGGQQFLVDLPRKSSMKHLMHMVCKKMQRDQALCLNGTSFIYEGTHLSPDVRTEDSALTDQTVVSVKTPEDEENEKQMSLNLVAERKSRLNAAAQLRAKRSAMDARKLKKRKEVLDRLKKQAIARAHFTPVMRQPADKVELTHRPPQK